MDKKPYRITVCYCHPKQIRNKLNQIGVIFTEKDIFSGFWGKEFSIEKPRGKGAHEKMKQINLI